MDPIADHGKYLWSTHGTAVGPALAALAEAHGNVTAAVCEITEWASLIGIIRAQPPDAIVHCAAIVGVIHAVQAPQKTMRVNVEGAMTLFEAMRLFDIPRMVHMSSEETYGHFQAPVIDDEEVKIDRSEVLSIVRHARLFGWSNRWIEQYSAKLAEPSR